MLFNEGFVLLGGDPSKWDQDMLDRIHGGASLTDVQKDQYRAGRESAELIKGRNGWSIRSATSLDDRKVILSGEFSKTFAVTFGKEWTAQDQKNREFFARRPDLTKGEIRKWSV